MSAQNSFQQAITVKYCPNSFRFRASCQAGTLYTHRDDTDHFDEGYAFAANKLAKKLKWNYHYVGGGTAKSVVFVPVGHPISHITVEIHTYRDKTYGNTYCSYRVTAHFRDGTSQTFTSGPENNSVSSAEYYAGRLLNEKGLLEGFEVYPNGGAEYLKRWCERKGVLYFTSVETHNRLSQLRW